MVSRIETCNHCYQKESQQGESQTQNFWSHQTLKVSATLRCQSSDKLSILFEQHHVRSICSK